MGRIVCAAVVAAGLGLSAGCGGGNSGASATEGPKAGLEELGEALKSLAAEGRNPPGKLAEFESIEPLVPVCGPQIRNGEVVYFWGAGYAAGGDKVVAHEKKAPAEGGLVLLQNGKVKTMTAAEFQAAPKAK
jgi:hypothetical protein